MDQTNKKVLLFKLVIGAEVDKRGGRVEIHSAEIVPLLRRRSFSKVVGNAIEFTLTAEDGGLHDRKEYSERFLYRLDVVMKHLLATSENHTLTFTNEDLERGRIPLVISPRQGGLLVQTGTGNITAEKGSRTIIFGSDGLIISDDLPDNLPEPPLSKKH